jgi:hypothetical protein
MMPVIRVCSPVIDVSGPLPTGGRYHADRAATPQGGAPVLRLRRDVLPNRREAPLGHGTRPLAPAELEVRHVRRGHRLRELEPAQIVAQSIEQAFTPA